MPLVRGFVPRLPENVNSGQAKEKYGVLVTQ